MNILLINHYAGSKMHGMEYRPYYMSREWVQMGHQVTIVAADQSHLRTKNPVVQDEFTEEWLDGIRYVWLKTPPYEGNGVKRAFNMFSFVGKLYKYKRRIIELSQPDVVIASSTYPLDTYPAASIARQTGAKLIFEVHDLWPLSPMVLGGMSPWHPFIFIMQRGENYAMRTVDGVVSILPKANLHLVDHGMDPKKYTHIPNGVDVAEWEGADQPLPTEHEQVIRKYKEEGYFLVGYAGSIGP
ncbi:MAG TPA: glycosyltransferase WbuB, partial [Paenibacillaceae bacterium]|nr:glycosyltransferase WbuB [Paenibacillaceae bacterium]